MIDAKRLSYCLASVAIMAHAGPVLGQSISPSVAAASEQASRTEDPLLLWYRQPAKEWTEAMPLGNGRLGAMVFGGVAEERIALNEDTLWSGARTTTTIPALRAPG